MNVIHVNAANIIPMILIGCSSTLKSQVRILRGNLNVRRHLAITAEANTLKVQIDVRIVEVKSSGINIKPGPRLSGS